MVQLECALSFNIVGPVLTFVEDFALDDLVGWFATNKGLTGKYLAAAGACEGFFGEVFEDAFSEALNEVSIATLLVVVQKLLTVGTVDFDGFGAAHGRDA